MERKSTCRVRSRTSYQEQLRRAIGFLLPSRCGLGLLSDDRRLRWTDRMLVIAAVLMAWASGSTLADRFAEARSALVGMYTTRRRPGGSYPGLAKAMRKRSAGLLAKVCAALRGAVSDQAQGWRVGTGEGGTGEGGWIVFGVDSTKHDCPRTLVNEAHFGCASKKGSWPQQVLTVVFHLGTGLPWAFVRGVARACERSHLLQMLNLLPCGPDVMLLADAGFTGYDLLASIMRSRRHFVIRVGANVRLLRKLGYALKEHDGIVYLWPQDKQGRTGKGNRLPKDLSKALARASEPLVLRLIRLTDERNRVVCLLSDILDPSALSDAQAGRLYRLRWKVEVAFRSLKQTLGRRKLLSESPVACAAELDWCVVGLWMLGLMGATATAAASTATAATRPTPSMASVLRRVRGAMNARQPLRLSDAVQDAYTRKRPRQSRQWPHKKRSKPPGEPRARMASELEVKLAQQLRQQKPAA